MPRPMKRLAREIENLLAGPPVTTQTEFAKRIGITKSKISRILSGRITCDQHTLDQLLVAATTREAKVQMITAFIQDLVSPLALELLRGDSNGDMFGKLEVRKRLSPKGEKTIRAILHSPQLEAYERMLADLVDMVEGK